MPLAPLFVEGLLLGEIARQWRRQRASGGLLRARMGSDGRRRCILWEQTGWCARREWEQTGDDGLLGAAVRAVTQAVVIFFDCLSNGETFFQQHLRRSVDGRVEGAERP